MIREKININNVKEEPEEKNDQNEEEDDEEPPGNIYVQYHMN